MSVSSDKSPRRRSRFRYLAGMLFVVGLGLLWRSRFLHLPPVVTKYGGDALWALLVFLLCGWIRPQSSTTRIAMISLTVACTVEFSQLYHAPWIDHVRSTRLGALVLGSTFNWPDMPAYALGVLAGVVGEAAFRRQRGMPLD